MKWRRNVQDKVYLHKKEPKESAYFNIVLKKYWFTCFITCINNYDWRQSAMDKRSFTLISRNTLKLEMYCEVEQYVSEQQNALYQVAVALSR